MKAVGEALKKAAGKPGSQPTVEKQIELQKEELGRLLCSELKKGSKVALVAAKIGCDFCSCEFQNWSIPLLLSGTLFSRDSYSISIDSSPSTTQKVLVTYLQIVS
ncbi:hypothetical protein VNO77_46809 [Canavalia gladiata]|uniref:Uncharacterized protein n=1 Tax=Canavalia gladiata TaxID=3824 RepID=A0AAN9JHR6_CANGL